MTSPVLSRKRSLSAPALTAAIGCAICLALSLIPLFMGIFPVFLEPVSTEFGWGRSLFPQAPMIVGLTAAVAGPFIGRVLDRKGVRGILPIGFAIWYIGLFSLSLMDGSVAALYLVAVVIGIGGTIAGPIAFAKIINGWFDRNRGLALGLVMSGVPAIATAIAIQVAQGLIDLQGWRVAYRILAIVAAVIAIPTALLLVREAQHRDAPGHARIIADGLTGSEAFRSRDFLLTIGASCIAVGALMGVTNHFLGWMTERGVDKDMATLALSLFSLAGPLGPIVGGFLVDRVSSPKVVASFFAMGPMGMGLLLFGGNAAVVPGMVFFGLGFSSINGLAPYLISRYFGMKAGSEILAVTFAALTIGMGVGPVLIGLGHDIYGGYGQTMAMAGGAMLFTLIAALFFQPYRFSGPPRP
ncbi:MFS transporter [Nitrospirillum viridazoti]|uniref:MFS family arabinose efflux permease n=1 Tax=Nitrospirillum amazonense TaxID=28077 RepID=A0A560HPC5_9PROT|nr:MFS transporter [Nitrospirillum amazonense]TWB46960.1 putative MFS family arabinose efflux permease [Nitrospirillum amazonense]